MNKEKNQLTKEKIKKEILISMIFFIVLTIGIIILGHYRNQPVEEPWLDEEKFKGGIIVSPDNTEKEEIPPNIFDKYGLEYEYIKIPSLGICTYVPVGWEIIFEKDFIYFNSKDEDGEYKNTEIAFCVMDVENFANRKELLFSSYYIERNLRNHCKADSGQLLDLLITTTNNNTNYQAVYDENEKLVAYILNPYVTFADENDPYRANRNEYGIHTLFYYINTNSDTMTFCSVVGQKGYKDYIEEIGKTVFENTKKYELTQFDYNEFEKTKLREETVGKMFYRIIDTEYVEKNGTGWNLSTNIKSLAFNCNLFVFEQYLGDKTLENFLDEDIMENIWIQSNEVAGDYIYTIKEKKYDLPDYRILLKENFQKFNKNCKAITWQVTTEKDSSIRCYVDSIIPAYFTTYLIPDGDMVYVFTINYNKYQKDSALQFMEKILNVSGFRE